MHVRQGLISDQDGVGDLSKQKKKDGVDDLFKKNKNILHILFVCSLSHFQLWPTKNLTWLQLYVIVNMNFFFFLMKVGMILESSQQN